MLKALIFITLIVGANAFAMTANEAIKKQEGCYEVTFKFAETFPLKSGYEIKAPYSSGGLEWVEVDRDTSGEVHLQHILAIPGMGALKHWRQEWTYEASSIFEFKGDKRWVKRQMSREESQGEWTQRVYQVDDSPRYECSAPWVIWKDQAYWECQSWNPLPRREFSTRSDYNVLERRNRHQLTSYGWVHEQDNRKVIAENGVEVEALVKEKGENTYKKVDDSRCAEVRTWWSDNKTNWWAIQSSWRRIYNERNELKFQTPEGQPILWQALFELASVARSESLTPQQVEERAYTLISSYLTP